MSRIQQALCWAAAILLVALGNLSGFVDDAAAQTMFVVLPALAVTSFGARRCRLAHREA